MNQDASMLERATEAAHPHDLRILYLTKVYPYPPANAGDAVYSRGIIEALSGTCSVTVLCADSGAPRRDAQGIDWRITEPQRAGRAGSVLSRWPLIAWKGATPSYLGVLDELLQQTWDVIVLDNIGIVHALPRAEAYRASHPGTKLVYVSHEHEYAIRSAKYSSYRLGLVKRIMAGRDLRKVRDSEEILLKRCDIVTVINTSDLTPFRQIAPERKYFAMIPGYDGTVVAQRRITSETPRRILLLGGRRSEQKRQILLDWMKVSYGPLTAAGVEIVIAGDMDEDLLQTLRHVYPEAQVLGFVEDIEALIQSARMGVIADTVGGGFKMRLLSHVFQRLPIVGLSGAIDGLPTPLGKGYLGTENLSELVRLVCQVIDDPDQLNDLQERAFRDCEKSFSWRNRAVTFMCALRTKSAETFLL